MISAKKKGIKKQVIGSLPESDGNESLKHLPKYICYKAALLREKLVLWRILVGLSFLFASYFVTSRLEIAGLQKKLRTKEYILAPGVQSFTTVAPQSVPDDYVSNAVNDFISSLGNVNSSNIREAYSGLRKFMSDSFRIRFETEARDWVKQVQDEDLAQILKITSKKIISDGQGSYQVTAFARADFYMAGQYLGHEDQVVEIRLRLVPPDNRKRWYLEIVDLKWSKLERFKTQSKFRSLKK